MEIVQLCVEGLTNDGIANRLGLSVGTVNTYWLRIKLKAGGLGRTDVVANIIKERAERVLEVERVDWEGLESILGKRAILEGVADKERALEARTMLALLHLAMERSESTVWATSRDLTIHLVANGELPTSRSGVKWQEGKTIYEVFKTENKAHPAVAAHLAALEGSESELRLSGESRTCSCVSCRCLTRSARPWDVSASLTASASDGIPLQR